MYDDISKIDFDIAFLSCGMYSIILGDLIKNKLKKKAIYIGGMLNVIFNFLIPLTRLNQPHDTMVRYFSLS